MRIRERAKVPIGRFFSLSIYYYYYFFYSFAVALNRKNGRYEIHFLIYRKIDNDYRVARVNLVMLD